MISFRPLWGRLGRMSRDLQKIADDRWEIGPASMRFIAPAHFLPGQLDLIQGTEFGDADHILADFKGGFESPQTATYGYRLRDVDLVDGALYTAGGVHRLAQPRKKLPLYRRPTVEMDQGAIFESWVGNRWFGNWLSDDCPRYLLAERFGTPVTTRLVSTGHQPAYEALAGMTPNRIDHARFKELVLFEDLTMNTERAAREAEIRTRLTTAVSHDAHPGTFILRGRSGSARVLENEREIAERLATERGFTIIDPPACSTEEIITACAGARVVAGIEGSHLVHGLAVMAPGSALFVIQPATRVTSALKFITDRQGMVYTFLIADGPETAMRISFDDVARTLDLLP